MPEVQEVFRMATNKVKPDPNALERQDRRQRSAARSGRARAYLAVAAVIALIAVGTLVLARRETGTAATSISAPPVGITTHFLVDVRTGDRTALPARSRAGAWSRSRPTVSTLAYNIMLLARRLIWLSSTPTAQGIERSPSAR